MALAINHSILLQSQPTDLALYLRELLDNYKECDISTFLFSAVENESLPPTIFSLWLSISSSTSTLLRALEQDFSVYVRYVAMKRFKKLVRRRDWTQVWNGVGGTLGILTLLSKFSVIEVQTFIRSLPQQLNKPENTEQREKVTELLKALLPSTDLESKFRTLDERPFTNTYSLLIPGCTSKFVEEELRKENNPLINYSNKTGILKNHYEVLRLHCLSIGQASVYPVHVNEYLDSLFTISPPLQSHKRGFSESMLFSLNVLRNLVAQSDLQIPGKSVLPDIIEPLVRRARKKQLPWKDIEEIMDLAIKYLEAHPEEGSQLSFNTNSFLYFSVGFWVMCNASARPEFENHLVSVLCHSLYDRSRILRESRKVLNKAPRQLRYRLLCIIFLNSQKVKADINTPEGLIDGEKWPCELFLDLELHDAIHLLKRLQNVNITDGFLQKAESRDCTILSSESSQRITLYTSSVLLGLFLEQGQPGSLERSTLAVKQQKEKAAKSREQPDRAFHAKFALLYAIASGSITLYGETLLWCRRWIRDPLTVKAVFSKGTINTEESISLLSGIPMTSKDSDFMSLSDVSIRVAEANKVMFALFETVCLALKEPSFYLSDWAGCLRLPFQVIKQRMYPREEIQKVLQISNEHEIYDSLWSDTLDVVLRIEKISLEPGYEALNIAKSPTLPSPSPNSTASKKISPASYRFIDNLANGRDALWRQYRIAKHPIVTVLPRCLPQGLPIQDLSLSVNLDVEEATSLTPYIYSRSISIVFQNTEIASTPVSNDRDTRVAIGYFINSFSYALRIFVLQGPASEKESRISQAWKHTLENLSYRMTLDEAYRTWRAIFQAALPQVTIPSIDPVQSNEYPRLPYESEGMEWNPAEGFQHPPFIEPRSMEPQTYLDCSISIPQVFYHGSNFYEPTNRTMGYVPRAFNIWSTTRLSKGQWTIPAVREGMIVSALLYIDSQTDDGSRLLNKPFPSRSITRYPALWLDVEFMELDSVGIAQAMNLIKDKRFLSTAPPTLLLKLARAAIDHLAKAVPKESVAHGKNIDWKICNIVGLLTRSDRPHLAVDLVLKIIIEYPDASSWHRQFLSNKFMKRLSADQSRKMLQRLSSAIQNQMREMANSSKSLDSTIPASSAPKSKSYVKITTIKYVAQLLKGASFVSPDVSLDILLGLLNSSTHIDIRVAVVRSLLEMLDACSIDVDKAHGNKIFSVLEALIPIAGDLDERRQLQTEDWAVAERDQKLPEVFEQGTLSLSDSVPPIVNELMRNRYWPYEDHWKVPRVKRLLIPILEYSISTNQKWLEVFASKYGLDLASPNLPILPVKLKVLEDLIHRYTTLVPASLLNLYHRFVLINILRPQEIAALNKKLEGPEFRELQETKHWLSMFGRTPSSYFYKTFDLLSKFKRHGESTDPKCITMSQVENLAFSQAKALLFYPDSSQIESFMSLLKTPPFEDYASSRSAKALVKRVVDLIDSLRTPAWQRDPNRNPKVLPNTLTYRIWLLPYPARETSSIEEITVSANAIKDLLDEVCTPETAYHHHLAEFDHVVLATPDSRRVELACALGELKEHMQTADLLSLEIASKYLFAAIPPEDARIIDAARKLVDSWSASENEWIRVMGKRCLTKSNFSRSGPSQKWAEILIGGT